MRYDAFISYRHAPLDMEIAKKLHKALETYHIPASVRKKTGKKRINRVFRDQEELPIGSDLNDNISSALKEAEYLIVICSKDTPESYWVLKEIETFIGMHDREHVLAILIDGEPWEAFPAPLLVDDAGNPVEPLAADIRANNAKERNSKFNAEFLRLAAPVIGCTYDDLKQRHKERIIKRNLAIGFAAVGCLAVFGTVFGIYNAFTASRMKKLAEEKAELANEKTLLAGEILKELQAKQINQSRFYAEKSESLLKSGKREDAVLVALAGLPDEENDRPLVSEAEYALGNALNAYTLGDKLYFDKTLTLDYNLKNLFLNDERTLLTTADTYGNAAVWDTETSEKLTDVPVPLNPDGNYEDLIGANADKNAVYVCYRSSLVKYDYNHNKLAEYTPPDTIRICDFHTSAGKVAFSDKYTVTVLDLSDFSVLFQKKFELPDGVTYGDLVYSPEYDTVIAEQSVLSFNNKETIADFIDLDTGKATSVSFPADFLTQIKFTKNGNAAILYTEPEQNADGSNNRHLSLLSKDGKLLWSKSLEGNYYLRHRQYDLLDSNSYSDAGGDHNYILASTQYDSYTFDETSGELISSFSHPAPICGQYLAGSSEKAFLLFLDGTLNIVDISTGQYYPDYSFQCSFDPETIRVGKKGDTVSAFIVEASSPYVHGLSFSQAADLKEFLPNEERFSLKSVETNGRYFSVASSTTNEYRFYDSDGTLLYSTEIDYSALEKFFVDGVMVTPDNDGFTVTDPVKQTTEHLFYSEIPDEEFTNSYYSVHSVNGQKNMCVYSGREVYVLDVINRKCILHFSYDRSIRDAVFSPDGKTLFLLFDDSLKIIDSTTGEEKNTDSLNLVPSLKDVGTSDLMTVSPNGRYFALYCRDSKIRIIDMNDCSLYYETEAYSSNNPYMFFSNDEKKFAFQGSDFRVFFFSLETQEFVNFLDMDSSISLTVFDEEDGLLALTDSVKTYLLSTEDYGLLAAVRSAYAYLPEKNQFLVFMGQEINTLNYKNYEELIAETKRQFPDAELTPQKKINYNID